MSTNDDLARWGEGPTDAEELSLAETLSDDVLEVDTWMRQLVQTILEQSGVFAGWLRLACSRILPTGVHPIASTHAMPTTLRDLRRVPDDADRVTLRTGDRVRVEVVCDRPGHLAILNVGPGGNLHLLHQEQAVRPGEVRHLFDAEMVPPTGRERLYAIWTRDAAGVSQLADLIRPGATLRDMVRVQETLVRLPDEDWHAVVLELDHQG